ncbi:MAG: hypothetical protein K6B14_03455 [Lachnospiraceae bacterium]|nr:hypothetical protein [Lachnospiraceae bacterium]
MDNTFKEDEKLYRAIWPPEIMPLFWKSNGCISTAALCDKNGLSVERGNYRADGLVVADMKKRLSGIVLYLTVRNVFDVGAVMRYLPSKTDKYHSEIHGSDEDMILSKVQRTILAKKVVILGRM